jgi:hypothetical protein
MFAPADAVARATRFVVGAEEPALWTVAAGSRVVGSRVRDADGWWLSRFAGADRRLVICADPASGDPEAFATLGRRLGTPVEPQSSPS